MDATNGHQIDAGSSYFGNLFVFKNSTDSTETLQIRAYDGTDWSDWVSFTLTTVGTNRAPVVTVKDIALGINKDVNLWDQLLKPNAHFTDADNDGFWVYDGTAKNNKVGLRYEIKDTTGAQNFYLKTGQAINAFNGYVIEYHELAAGEIWIKGDSSASTQTLQIRAFDGADWSAWDDFTLTTGAGATKPSVSVSDQSLRYNPQRGDTTNLTENLISGGYVSLDEIITSSDPNGDTILKYNIRDLTGGFKILYYNDSTKQYNFGSSGLRESDGWYLDLAVSQLKNFYLVADKTASSYDLQIRAYDGKEWGDWSDFKLVTTTVNTAPVVTIADQSLNSATNRANLNAGSVESDFIAGTYIRIIDIQNYYDADGDGHEYYNAKDYGLKYEILDNTGEQNIFQVGSGFIDASAGYTFDIQQGNSSAFYFIADSGSSAQEIKIRVWDGREWSDWDNFTLTTTNANSKPTVSTTKITLDSGHSNHSYLAEKITFSDPNGDSVVKYEIKDTTGIQNFHNFSLYNYAKPHLTNTELDASNGYVFNADQLGNIKIMKDANAGTQTLQIRAYDGTDWSDWADITFETTGGGNRKPVVSVNDIILQKDEKKRLWDSFLKHYDFYSDPDSDKWYGGGLKYEIKDTTGIQNFFYSTDYTNASNPVAIDASNGYTFGMANRNEIWIKGDSSDSTQTLQIRAWDGLTWSDWDNFTLTTTNANSKPTVSTTKITLDSGHSNHSYLAEKITFSDPNGDSVVKYEIKDTTGIQNFHNFSLYNYAKPHLTNTELDASNGYVFNADQLGNIKIMKDANAGTQTLQIRAYDGTDWSDWADITFETTGGGNRKPVVSVNDIILQKDEKKRLWDSFLKHYDFYSDPDSDKWYGGGLKYEIKDTTGIQNFFYSTDYTNASNPVAIDASNGYTFGMANRNEIWIKGDSSDSTQTLQIRAWDGLTWSDWDSFEFKTEGNQAKTLRMSPKVKSGVLDQHSDKNIEDIDFYKDQLEEDEEVQDFLLGFDDFQF